MVFSADYREFFIVFPADFYKNIVVPEKPKSDIYVNVKNVKFS